MRTLGVAGKVLFMVFDGTDNMGMEALTIWLWRHKKSTSLQMNPIVMGYQLTVRHKGDAQGWNSYREADGRKATSSVAK